MDIKCTKCNQIKDEYYFYKNKNTKNGFNAWCKDCDNERRRRNRKQYKQAPKIKYDTDAKYGTCHNCWI